MSENIRGDIIAKRAYCRPKDLHFTERESWEEVCDRVVSHSERLWREAGGTPVTAELDALRDILLTREQALVAGRTLWLGGTELAFRRPCCQFNCAFSIIDTVEDLRDIFWLLLNGAGTGFNPRNTGSNCLTACNPDITLTVTHSTQPSTYRGREETQLTVTGGTYSISVGDSATGWTHALELLIKVGDYDRLVEPVYQVHIDFSECRGAGEALKGYGWLCIGSDPFARALCRVFDIMQGFVWTLNGEGQHIYDRSFHDVENKSLTPIQVLDIVNSLGEVLSTRRSAQIAQLEYDNPYIDQFIDAKSHENIKQFPWRMQSNNSVVFYNDPDISVVNNLKEKIRQYGTEPGIINADAALDRAPWFAGLNPCAEILLANKGFCNLVDINLSAFVRDDGVLDMRELERVIYIMARHNYRQTCVDLQDGILQEDWHWNNQYLRLCGVSLTGFGEHEPTPYELRRLKRMATLGAYSMALELGTELPKNITTIKPSGTVSKVMGTSEGIHTPIGRYIFNWVVFNTEDPLVALLEAANYRTMIHPTLDNTTLINLPIEFKSSKLQESEHGFEYDDEPVEHQFERYMRIQNNWCDQNVSNTLYYKPEELDTLFDLVLDHWDEYVAFSFMPRQDLSKPKEQILKECNAPYLPQELVTKEEYDEYVSQLKPVDVFAINNDAEFDLLDEDGCANGVCPIR